MTQKIFAALIKAQEEFPAIHKTSTNPHFKNKYADLSEIIGKVTPTLCKHALGFTQTLRDNALVTKLIHESGECLEYEFPLLVSPTANMQQLGSAVTYARRYSLAAALGIAAEDDDDGNDAATTQAAMPKKVPAIEVSHTLKEACKRLADRMKAEPTTEGRRAILHEQQALLHALEITNGGHEYASRLRAIAEELVTQNTGGGDVTA